MKPIAFNRHKFSGELYKAVLKTVGSTTTSSYYFVDNISFTIGMNVNGKVVVISDQPEAIGSLIANIKDANGNLVLDDQVWQVNGLLPIMNAFNTVEQYRMTLLKYQGTI